MAVSITPNDSIFVYLIESNRDIANATFNRNKFLHIPADSPIINDSNSARKGVAPGAAPQVNK